MLRFPVGITQNYKFPGDWQYPIYVAKHSEGVLNGALSGTDICSGYGLDNSRYPWIAYCGGRPILPSTAPMKLRTYFDVLKFGLEKGDKTLRKLNAPRRWR